ncbi:MAG: TldD/PmbA family protein [Candidatus Aminicenantes bacterium]|nr:MAG: TldD/PmbA family protein [Candidatus Aminicenantes bacterium]
MNYKLLAENVVKKALKLGADEAEVYLENGRDFELSIRNGDVETIKQATSKGMGLTVFKDKKLGFSYTSDFSDKSLEEFTKKTVQLSLVADPKPWNGLPDFKKGKIQDLDLYDSSISEIPNEKKIDIAKEAEKIALAYDKKITKSQGGFFGDAENEVIIVNSKGISYSYKSSGVGFGAGVVAGEGGDMQSGGWSTSKRHFKDLDAIENVAKKAGKRAVEKLGAKPVPTQKAPVVFDRYAGGSFWYGILFAMNGDSVYKKTTFLTDYLDKPIASKLITITDDPIIPRHIASVPFDGEGNITRKNILIDKGVLRMFIYDTITARKAGVEVNTIVGRRGYRSPPRANFLNIVVQNGSVSREKIISGIKNGFYVTGLRGIGTDIPTGTYSCGASGFWIKDGEIAFPVDGITLGGNTLDILKNIEIVADDIDIRGGLNSPSFKISEITVGGKK